MSYLVLARKWRPSKFSEVVGQDHAVAALKNSISSQNIHHAYLFTGTRGIGKTSIARILAKALNCSDLIDNSEPCNTCESCKSINEGAAIDFIEIDAASRRGIEDTKNLLETISYLPSSSRYKIYLIDEVHMLTPESFNALLKNLEEPPPHVIFMFATTEYKKILPTIISRCLQINLSSVSVKVISDQLGKIFSKEKIKLLYDPILKVNSINIKKREKIENRFLNTNYILSIGRLTKQKNFFLLISAFKEISQKYPNLKLIILGEGDERKKLEKLIEDLNLSGSVFLEGYKKNIFNYLNNCECYISSSLYEDPGFSLIESGFLNKPVIAADSNTGPSEILNNSKNGFLFRNNDKTSLVDQYFKLKNSNTKDVINKKINLKKFSKNFSVFRHFKNFEKILSN